jgi:periplasmic protein TonB
VASAVNSRCSPASPSASPAKSGRASFQSSRKSNPVALEVTVVATGARPGHSDDRPKLFTEETSTVLVFESGAVIRLSAAVAAGQLVFLTNKDSRREVVAQITRKRDFRPTSCYADLEFIEPAPGFWGIDFPEDSELVPANAHQQEAAELVQASRTVGGKPRASAPAPSAKEIDALKREVEALRQQLKSLQTQSAAGNSSAPPAPTNFSSTAPHVSPTLPIDLDESPSFETSPLPEPVIRINRRKPPATPSLNPNPASDGKAHSSLPRIALFFAALLFVAASAAWYLHWIPQLPFSKKHSANAPTGILIRTVPAVSSAPSNPAGTHSDSAKPAQTITAPAPQSVAASPVATQPTRTEVARPSGLSAPDPAASRAPAKDAPVVQQDSVITSAASKRSVPRSTSDLSADSAAPSSQGVATVPPKLIKSVQAVASPNALQYFDKSYTATVTLDTLVDSSGHVKSMKVLSGPASLRDAAMDALKQYRYAPATQRGKPVPAHVTTTIKFLFEP